MHYLKTYKVIKVFKFVPYIRENSYLRTATIATVIQLYMVVRVVF